MTIDCYTIECYAYVGREGDEEKIYADIDVTNDDLIAWLMYIGFDKGADKKTALQTIKNLYDQDVFEDYFEQIVEDEAFIDWMSERHTDEVIEANEGDY